MVGPLQLSPYQAVYRACVKDAAVHGAALMQATLARALEQGPASAAALADLVERSLLQEALAVLREQKQPLADTFPQVLLAEFAQAIAGDRSCSLGLDALPLLGDEQLQDNTELVRAAQELQQAVQPQLAALEALLAAAQLPSPGGAQRHPLRPEVYVRALHRTARQMPVSATVRRRWLRHLPAAMAPELARSYETTAASLRAQGVRVAAPPPAAAPGTADRATQLTIRELRKLLAGEAPPRPVPAEAAPETDFAHTVPAALQLLQDMRKVDLVLQQLRQRQAAMPGDAADGRAAMREAMRQQAQQPAQRLGLEVVHLLVEHVAGDERLLAPIQETVRDLEPALLRLALDDPRFFSDRAHPARQLLEQLTQRSLGWSHPQQEGFPAFLEGVQQAVEVLLETRARGGEPFEIALAALQEAWEDAQPRARRSRERAVRALLRAEQRNLLAERIGRQLAARPDAAAAPPAAMAFLTGPWAQVMAQARLADESGQDDPGGFAALVQTLLWSVQPALAARVAAQHAWLVERTDAGLATITHPPAETQRWQAVLRQLRTAALYGDATAGPPVSEAAALLARAQTWLAPVEAHDSGYVPEPAPGFRAEGEGETLPPLELDNGAWVEMLEEGWHRWQLAWASPHGLLFMFVQAGGATRSMTRRLLQQMLAEGSLRLVSERAVVDGALDAVVRAAWRNSAKE